jgi:hypothetical protein
MKILLVIISIIGIAFGKEMNLVSTSVNVDYDSNIYALSIYTKQGNENYREEIRFGNYLPNSEEKPRLGKVFYVIRSKEANSYSWSCERGSLVIKNKITGDNYTIMLIHTANE